MRTILPGKPRACLQAVAVGLWRGKRLVAYISSSALVILDEPTRIVQTIYPDQEVDLTAVAFDEASGKIAVCAGRSVLVYRPCGLEDDALRWSLQDEWALDNGYDPCTTLSWGQDEELLVGGAFLVIISTHNTPTLLWRERLSSTAKYASFSHDAGLIATTGRYDHVVKVWKRMIFGSDGIRFEHGYLPHPAPVTQMHWRQPLHKEQHMDSVLYTVCADKRLRIWSPIDPHGLQFLQLWGEIDLMESIQPRSIALADRSNRRFAFVIDSRDFSIATEQVVQHASDEDEEQHALEHLVEIATRNPEMCVVLDDRGNMSAWGLKRVGCKVRQTSDIFNAAHSEGLRLHLPSAFPSHSDHVQFYNFSIGSVGHIALLVHHFDGRLEWFDARLDELFDPGKRGASMQQKAMWTGHSNRIRTMTRDISGNALLSCDSGQEGMVWRRRKTGYGACLTRHSSITQTEQILNAQLLQDGNLALLLSPKGISLWSTRSIVAVELARTSHTLVNEPSFLIGLKSPDGLSGAWQFAAVCPDGKGVVWDIVVSAHTRSPSVSKKSSDNFIKELAHFDLGGDTEIYCLAPITLEAGMQTRNCPTPLRTSDALVSCTARGKLSIWNPASHENDRGIRWKAMTTLETGTSNASLLSSTSLNRTAIVDEDRTEFTIWNSLDGNMEFQQTLASGDIIQEMSWSSTTDQNLLLAIASQSKIVIFGQLRYKVGENQQLWTSLREISIRNLTPHPLDSLIWLDNAVLAAASGNQIFVYDGHIQVPSHLHHHLRITSKANQQTGVFGLVDHFNKPLPLFHTQFLSHYIMSGRFDVARLVIAQLYKKLKFFTEGDVLNPNLDLDLWLFLSDRNGLTTSEKTRNTLSESVEDVEFDTVTQQLASNLNQLLLQKELPGLSDHEQLQLTDLVVSVSTLEKHHRAVDENGGRFVFLFQQRTAGGGQDTSEISRWRETMWAWHSSSQEILIDLVSRQFQGRMLWQQARDSGIFMWTSDLTAVRAQFEAIARNEYTKTDEKNPVDCSLYYLALRKKAVLAGLWRMASWNREQASTSKLLANNFNDARWKSAALKNAYALMGKHRFEYAAAFFLLGDALKPAVNVIFNQMGDMQLAIAVARVYEGDDGPVLRELLEEKVLPVAVSTCDRWLTSWVYTMLGRHDDAIRALVLPLNILTGLPEPPAVKAKHYANEDPTLIELYQYLRSKSLKAPKPTITITPSQEWDFVLRTARLYRRMGCDLLALQLVKNWSFADTRLLQALDSKKGQTLSIGEDRAAQTKDNRTEVVELGSGLLAEFAGSESGTANGTAHSHASNTNGDGGADKKSEQPEKKPPPTQFKEPAGSSLLDSFGF